jgi:hypothetical protein
MSACIMTKYLGPTDRRGARVKAWSPKSSSGQGPCAVLSWDHAWSVEGNHDGAAIELAAQLGWLGGWASADMPQGRVYVRLGSGSLAFKVSELRPRCRTVARTL